MLEIAAGIGAALGVGIITTFLAKAYRADHPQSATGSRPRGSWVVPTAILGVVAFIGILVLEVIEGRLFLPAFVVTLVAMTAVQRIIRREARR